MIEFVHSNYFVHHQIGINKIYRNKKKNKPEFFGWYSNHWMKIPKWMNDYHSKIVDGRVLSLLLYILILCMKW